MMCMTSALDIQGTESEGGVVLEPSFTSPTAPEQENAVENTPVILGPISSYTVYSCKPSLAHPSRAHKSS